MRLSYYKYVNSLEAGFKIHPLFVFVIFIWSIFWKGLALWKAAKYHQKSWFIAILVVNSATIGILEIVYLFRFAKEKLKLSELRSLLKLGSK